MGMLNGSGPRGLLQLWRRSSRPLLPPHVKSVQPFAQKGMRMYVLTRTEALARAGFGCALDSDYIIRLMYCTTVVAGFGFRPLAENWTREVNLLISKHD
jgi:hypothetical protein